jgi:hypothetical protein
VLQRSLGSHTTHAHAHTSTLPMGRRSSAPNPRDRREIDPALSRSPASPLANVTLAEHATVARDAGVRDPEQSTIRCKQVERVHWQAAPMLSPRVRFYGGEQCAPYARALIESERGQRVAQGALSVCVTSPRDLPRCFVGCHGRTPCHRRLVRAIKTMDGALLGLSARNHTARTYSRPECERVLRVRVITSIFRGRGSFDGSLRGALWHRAGRSHATRPARALGRQRRARRPRCGVLLGAAGIGASARSASSSDVSAAMRSATVAAGATAARARCPASTSACRRSVSGEA